jgi:hypothetical protein
MVTWSGQRDAEGFASGKGTLTWYRADKNFQTGSLLPSVDSIVVVTRYSGTMVHGKLNGPVRNVDANGKTFQLTFANGSKIRGRPSELSLSPSPHESPVAQSSRAPAEGPSPKPVVHESPKPQPPEKADRPAPAASVNPTVKAMASPAAENPVVEVASIRSTPIPAAPDSSPADDIDSAVKERIVADFKDETQAVLSQVDEATDNFRSVERLDSMGKLPAPIGERVNALVQRARDFRSRVGYETALTQFRTETETVDALSAVDQINRSIAANDAAGANAKVADFLKSNPEPASDVERPLWRYLGSVRQVCSRLENEANVHQQRAESFAAAGRTSDAIREYQEAFRVFPNPATAEKIRQLQANSLGL